MKDEREYFIPNFQTRIGYQVGNAVDGFVGGAISFIIKLAIVVGIISLPCAAIKYLFWGS